MYGRKASKGRYASTKYRRFLTALEALTNDHGIALDSASWNHLPMVSEVLSRDDFVVRYGFNEDGELEFWQEKAS